MPSPSRAGITAFIAAVVAGCALAHRDPAPTPIALPFAAESLRTDVVAPGAWHRFIYASSGPWAVHVLEVDLDQCYRPVSVKGASGASGRQKTSALVAGLVDKKVVGGVNADFFTLTGIQGLPGGLLVSNGRVITGPNIQPAVAIDSSGVPHIGTLRVAGTAVLGGQRFPIANWNRVTANGLSLFDAAWGATMDTLTSAVEVVLQGRNPYRVVAVDTALAGVAIPVDGAVLIAGRTSSAALKSTLSQLKPGDAIDASVSLAPFHPREAVGGRPLLVRDSQIVAEIDTAGGATFAPVRHPRTAVGIARGGKRLILVVVDGRQKPYSDGMTLRELATLMLALGAPTAMNLDGGGSTAMALVLGGVTTVVNKPSDPAGERAVGDALAIVSGCRPRSP